MSRRRTGRCITFLVDGEPVRAYVDGAFTEKDLEALREIARAARRAAVYDPLPPEVIAAETWYNQALERSTHDRSEC